MSNCVWDKASLRCLRAEDSAVLPSPQIEAPRCNCKYFLSIKEHAIKNMAVARKFFELGTEEMFFFLIGQRPKSLCDDTFY